VIGHDNGGRVSSGMGELAAKLTCSVRVTTALGKSAWLEVGSGEEVKDGDIAGSDLESDDDDCAFSGGEDVSGDKGGAGCDEFVVAREAPDEFERPPRDLTL